MNRTLSLSLLLTACGASAASPAVPAAQVAPDPECVEAQSVILRDIATSSERACDVDADCTTITSPRHFVEEYDEVVHVVDAPALNARSRAHLDRCGATIHHESIAAIRVVSAVCIEAHCAVHETNLHLDE